MSIDTDADGLDATPCNLPHASAEGRMKIVPADEVEWHTLTPQLCPCLKEHDEHPVAEIDELGEHREVVVMHKKSGYCHQFKGDGR